MNDDDITSQPMPPLDQPTPPIKPQSNVMPGAQRPSAVPINPTPTPQTPSPVPQAPSPMPQMPPTPPVQTPLPIQPSPYPAPAFDGITPAPTGLAGEAMERTMAPGGLVYIPPPLGGKVPGRSKKKLIIIIMAIVVLLAVIGALIFYFAYWTNPNVVYARFQTTTASIITKSLTSGISMVDNTKYSAEVSGEYDGQKLSVGTAGHVSKGSSEAAIKLSYKDTPLELQIRQPLPASGKEADIYFKYQGLSKFIKVALGGNDDFGLNMKNIDKYDNKWIMLSPTKDLGGILGGPAEKNQKAEDSLLFTTDETTQLSKSFAPIISSRIAGTDKKNAIYSYDKPTSEVVNGQQTYAYKMKFNEAAFKGMLDELTKTVDVASLTDKKKTAAKDIINGLKTVLDSPDLKCDSMAKDRSDIAPASISYRQECIDTSFTIWLEKNTSLPVQIEVVAETKSYEGNDTELKTTYKTMLKAGITSFSGESVKGQLNITALNAKDNFNEYELLIKFAINPKTGKLVWDEIQVKINTNKGKDTQTINGKLTIEPSGETKPVEIPTPSVLFAKFLGDIYQTEPAPSDRGSNTQQQSDRRMLQTRPVSPWMTTMVNTLRPTAPVD